MTPEQKALIAASFQTLRSDPDTAAQLFYARLFEQHPALRPLFTGSMKHQGRKFMDMMDTALDCLDRLDNIVPLLWQMGKRHGGYGVTEAHYEAVGDALLWMLEQQIGADFTLEVRTAWEELYALMARTMQQAAAEGIILRPPLDSDDAPFPPV